MTYSDLVAALLAWTNRPEIEQTIPTLVALAEAQMGRDLAENGITGTVERADMTIAAEYVAVPAGIAVPLSLTLSTGERLENVTEQGFAAYAGRCGLNPLPASPDKPRAYTILGGEFRFWPVPATTYTAQLVYEASLTALGDATPTNWLIAAYPDAYLYGVLAQTAPFIEDDARFPTWAGLYQTAMSGLIKAERAKRGSQTTAAFRPNMPHRHRYGGFHAC